MGKHLLCIYPWLALGGSDKFNLDMLAQLRTLGWRVTVVTTLPSTHPWRALFAAVSDELIDLTDFPIDDYPARLLQIAHSREVDSVLVSHSTLGYHLLPYLRAHLPHLAYVDYCHIIEPDWRDGGYPRLSLRYQSQLDLQIVSSHHLKEWMCMRGGEPDQIAVCTTNIDTADWNSVRYDQQFLRHELGIAPDKCVVLYAGRLTRQKQPVLAARVMREVAQRCSSVTFLVAGDGEYSGYLRGYLRWHKLQERIRLLGAVDNQRMRGLLALSDIFFLPSEAEGISLAIYEAMAMGVVPVGAAVGGQAELVTRECGILIERGSDERTAYAQALVQLVQQPITRERMGTAARQRVDRLFRLEHMAMRMNSLLSLAHTLHQTQPRPPIDAETALAAARHARAAAREDEAELRQMSGSPQTARQRLRAWYWQLVDAEIWWLVPLAARVRALID